MSSSLKSILPILMVVASVWALIGYLWPKYEAIQVLSMQKKEYQQALDNASEARVRRGHLLEVYSSFSKLDWDRLGKMLPSEGKGVQLARDISGIANIFGITLNDFGFSEASDSSSSGAYTPPPQTTSGEDLSGGDPLFYSPPTPALSSKILELSFSVQTDYANFLRFLRELERSLGLLDVKSLTIGRASEGVTGGSEEEEIIRSGSESVYQFDLQVHTYWVE